MAGNFGFLLRAPAGNWQGTGINCAGLRITGIADMPCHTTVGHHKGTGNSHIFPPIEMR
jgi:hypothetical protein